MKLFTFFLQSSFPHKRLDGYKDYESLLENVQKNRNRCGLPNEGIWSKRKRTAKNEEDDCLCELKF